MTTEVTIPETPGATPQTSAVRIRRALIEGLRFEFERFLEGADPGDLYLLREMLELHNDDVPGPNQAGVVSTSVFLDESDDAKEFTKRN